MAKLVLRSLHELPLQGTAGSWRTPMDYAADAKLFAVVEDPDLQFF